jgi:predicted enzyme related to lactoylglutathione lyase
MTQADTPRVGSVGWHDLTVQDAVAIRDFYQAVVGWESSPVSMGEYDDYGMLVPATTEAVAGVCHARGPNANLPPQWLIYIRVADLESSLRQCAERGGEVIDGPRGTGEERFCVIRDPAGAVAALVGP